MSKRTFDGKRDAGARALLLILSLGRQAGVYGLNTTEVCSVKLSAALFLLLGVMSFASGDEPTVSLRKNEASRTGGATTVSSAHVLSAAGAISSSSPAILFNPKENDIMFSFRKSDKSYPTITLLDGGGRFHARAASSILSGLKEETDKAPEEERANVRLDPSATTLEFAFEGIRFKKQPDGTLKVMMVSGPVQFEFPQNVKQSELVSGGKISLSGQATRVKGFSSATMKIKIKIYFDSTTGQLQIIEANGDVSVQLPIGKPFTDPDELPQVIYGKKASVVTKPTVTLIPIEEA